MAVVKPKTDFVIQGSSCFLDDEEPVASIGTELLGFNSQLMGNLLMEIERQDQIALEQKMGAILYHNPARYNVLPWMSVPEEYRAQRADGSTLLSVTEV